MGLFPGVRAYVSCQVCFSLEALCAVSLGTATASSAPGARLHGFDVGGFPFSRALFTQAAREPVPGAKGLSPGGAPGRICRFPVTVTATGKMSTVACSPAPASRRFTGLCSMDSRCGYDRARDRGIVHAWRRSG